MQTDPATRRQIQSTKPECRKKHKVPKPATASRLLRRAEAQRSSPWGCQFVLCAPRPLLSLGRAELADTVETEEQKLVADRVIEYAEVFHDLGPHFFDHTFAVEADRNKEVTARNAD